MCLYRLRDRLVDRRVTGGLFNGIPHLAQEPHSREDRASGPAVIPTSGTKRVNLQYRDPDPEVTVGALYGAGHLAFDLLEIVCRRLLSREDTYSFDAMDICDGVTVEQQQHRT